MTVVTIDQIGLESGQTVVDGMMAVHYSDSILAIIYSKMNMQSRHEKAGLLI